jgi:molybdopterin converting factor small subunit
VRVRIAAFARLREIVGRAAERTLPDGSTADDLWNSLSAEFPALRELRASTRFARDDVFVDGTTPLGDGDEIALLPPFGGG